MQFDLSSAGRPSLPTASVDVLLAGPPCQGFSTAGKRDPDDPRNKLLIATARIAALIQPKVVDAYINAFFFDALLIASNGCDPSRIA